MQLYLTLVVCGFIIAGHVMFKELRNLLGKLLMLYNIAVMGMCILYIGQLLTSLQPLLDTLAFCYICTFGTIMSLYQSWSTGVLIVLLTISGNRQLQRPNGRCVLFDASIYSTFQIPITVNSINTIAQLVQFITYLYNVYKLNKDISDTKISSDQQSLLHKLAIAMAAFIGLASFLFIIFTIFDLAVVVIPFALA